MNAHRKAKAQARAERRAARLAGKHAQRHGLHVAEILRNQGAESYATAQATRAECALCREAVGHGDA